MQQELSSKSQIKTINGPQGNLAVENVIDGRKVPVMFVHSDCGVRNHWQSAISHIADKYPVVAFDRRGHGQSDPPRNQDYSIEGGAEDILAIANALKLERFALVGHSGGGGIAFVFAAQHPERVAGLLLVDPMPDPAALPPDALQSQLTALESGDYEKTLSEYYGFTAGNDKAIKERIVNDALSTARQTAIGALRAFQEFRPRAYASYQGPASAVIQSQFDSPDALHQIGGFPHTTIDGVGHWLQLGAPDKFNLILDGFLNRVARQKKSQSRKSA